MSFNCSSKLLTKKWEEKRYRQHQEKMRSMKSGLDNQTPKQYPHMVLRLKKIQREEERQSEIDHKNQILLQKMTDIMRKKGRVDNWNDYESRSLNQQIREKEQEKIAEQNYGIARRLEKVKPMYDIQEWDHEWQKHDYYMDLWASTTKDYEMISPRRGGDRSGASGDYEDDFEDEDESVQNGKKLPQIESRESTQNMGPKKEKKEPVKLPKIKSKKPAEQLMQEGSHHAYEMYWGDLDALAENDAKQLFKASKQMAKGDETVLKTLIRRSHSQRMATKNKFEDMYDMDLGEELKNGLGAAYGPIIDCLLVEREDGDAEAINSNIHGNNSSGLVEIICSRNPSALNSINKAYKRRYDVTIDDDVSARILDEDCQTFLVALLGTNRQGGDVDEELAENDAQDLSDGGDGRFTDEDGTFLRLMNERSMPQVKATFNTYKKVSGGQEIGDAMQDAGCSKDYVNAVKTMTKCMNSGSAHYADKINSALKSGDTKQLVSLLLARSEIDMPEIRKIYKKKYGSELIDDILKKHDRETGPLIAQIAAKASPGGQGKGKKGVLVPAPPKKTPMRQKPPPESNRKDAAKDNPLAQPGKKPYAPQPPGKKGKGKGTVTPSKTFNVDMDVKRIHEAMKGFGTDEDPLIEILSNRSNAQRQQIRKKYMDNYKKPLIDVLESELRGDFEELILALMMTSTEYDAYCLHDAMDGVGTAEAALIGILCTRNAKEIKNIKTHYKKSYDRDLVEDLKDDTSGDFSELLTQLTKGERDQSDTVDKQLAEKDAKQLYKDGKNAIEINDDTFREVLTKRNKAQVKATFEQYKKLSGHSIEQGIKNAMMGDGEDGYVGLVGACQDPVDFYANRLKDSMTGVGTNDKMLIRIIVSRSEVDLADIKVRFKQLTKSTLGESIEKECGGDYKKLLLAIVNGYEKTPKGAKAAKPAQLTPKRQKPAAEDTSRSVRASTDLTKKRFKQDGQANPPQEKANAAKDNTSPRNVDSKGPAKQRGTKTRERERPVKKEPPAKDKSPEREKTPLRQKSPVSEDTRPREKSPEQVNTPPREKTPPPRKKTPPPREKTPPPREKTPPPREKTPPPREKTPPPREKTPPPREKTPPREKAPPRKETPPREKTPEKAKTPEPEKAKTPERDPSPEKSPESEKSPDKDETPTEAKKETPEPEAQIQEPEPESKERKVVSKPPPKTHGTVDAYPSADASDDAEAIKVALDGWNNDESSLIEILANRTNSQRQSIKPKYKEKYDKELEEVLRDELKGDFEEIIVALMKEPIAFDAMCLKEGTKGLGTDESVINGILVSRTAEELSLIREAYKKEYGSDLAEDLRSDTSGDYQELVLQLVKGERDQSCDVDEEEAEEDAKKLYNEGTRSLSPNDDLFRNILTKKNKQQVKETFERYKQVSGEEIEEGIKKAMVGDTENALIALVKCLKDPVSFYAERIQYSMTGMGTNDNMLIRLIVSRSEIDMVEIKEKYNELYGKSLEDAISSECSGDYKKMLLALIADKEDEEVEKVKEVNVVSENQSAPGDPPGSDSDTPCGSAQTEVAKSPQPEPDEETKMSAEDSFWDDSPRKHTPPPFINKALEPAAQTIDELKEPVDHEEESENESSDSEEEVEVDEAEKKERPDDGALTTAETVVEHDVKEENNVEEEKGETEEETDDEGEDQSKVDVNSKAEDKVEKGESDTDGEEEEEEEEDEAEEEEDEEKKEDPIAKEVEPDTEVEDSVQKEETMYESDDERTPESRGVSGKSVKHMSDDGDPEQGAKSLYKLVTSGGLDVNFLRDHVVMKSHNYRQELWSRYQRLYGRNLITDLKKALGDECKNIVYAIMMTPVEYDVRSVRGVMSSLDSDPSVLVEILMTATPNELQKMIVKYQVMTKHNFVDDLTNDDDPTPLRTFLYKLSVSRRVQRDEAVDTEEARLDAMIVENDLSLKNDVFVSMVLKKTNPQLKATLQEYKSLTGNEPWAAVTGDNQGEEAAIATAVMILYDPVLYYTARLNHVLTKERINNRELMRLIVPRSPMELMDVKVRYQDEYGVSLEEEIERVCSPQNTVIMLEIIKGEVY